MWKPGTPQMLESSQQLGLRHVYSSVLLALLSTICVTVSPKGGCCWIQDFSCATAHLPSVISQKHAGMSDTSGVPSAAGAAHVVLLK